MQALRRRPALLAALLGALVVFLLVSFGLARALNASSTERREVIDAVETRQGDIDVLNVSSSIGFSLGGGEGPVRIAWQKGDGLPVVQCATVERDGNVITGIDVEVIRLSRPIDREGSCPGA